MEVPDLVRTRLEGENVQAGVNLGEEDALFLTPSKSILYDGEGLLSDEHVSVYPHDLERLSVSEGRRKTKFQCTYVDGTRSFSVPASRGETVLDLFLGGVLRVADVADPDESVEGVYRFSELTLIITEKRFVKHVGTYTWDEDYEEFPFEDVTGLAFEQGSVATQIVLEVDGRPQRIKAPNDKAPMLRRTLEEALYDFYDVESLQELNRLIAREDESDAEEKTGQAAGFGLEDDIDPLVGGDAGDAGDEGSADPGRLDSLDEGGGAEDEGLRPRSMDVDPSGRGGAGGESAVGGEAGSQGTPRSESAERTAQDPGQDSPQDRSQDPDQDSVQDRSQDPDQDSVRDSPQDSARTGSNPSTNTGTREDPAGGGSTRTPEAQTTSSETESTTESAPAERAGGAGADRAASPEGSDSSRPSGAESGSGPADQGETARLGPEDVDALESELAELREAVQAQNEVLREQHGAIERLLSELRSE